MEVRISSLSRKQMSKLVSESPWPMNSLCIVLPYSYVVGTIDDLGWPTILLAVENGYLSAWSAVEFARSQLERDSDVKPEVLALAILQPGEEGRAPDFLNNIKTLAASSPARDKIEAKDKLMYAFFQWLFDHRAEFEDIETAIEIAYDDFGFPDSLSRFAGYKADEPFSSARSAVYSESMLDEWNAYLESQQARFSHAD